MSYFIEYPRFMNLDIADMQEVYAAHFPKFTNDVGNIILTIGTEGTGTNRKSITFTVDHLSNLLEVTFVFDDTGQTKDGNRRIIGMNAHFNADFFSNRYDSLEEVFQVLAQAIFIQGCSRIQPAAAPSARAAQRALGQSRKALIAILSA